MAYAIMAMVQRSWWNFFLSRYCLNSAKVKTPATMVVNNG